MSSNSKTLEKAERRLSGQCVDCGAEERHSEYYLPNPFMEDFDLAVEQSGQMNFDVCNQCHKKRILSIYCSTDASMSRWDS